jgi:hypothetical protein
VTALHNLSASGWVLFAVTAALLLSFLARFVTRNHEMMHEHALVLGVLLVWMLWLVTP